MEQEKWRSKLEKVKTYHYRWSVSSLGRRFWESLSSQPGVYCFEDKNRTPLYIGKTIHLKTRLRQHLKEAEKGAKQADFIKKTVRLTFYEVSSEMESILLEAKLIKWHRPFYNAISKDDKSSIFMEITSEDFPKVLLRRESDVMDIASAFGPFRNRSEAEKVLKVTRRIFSFCGNPPNGNKKLRPCFYRHIDLCDGACEGLISKSDYRKKIGYIKKYLGGGCRTLLNSWRRKIGRLSREKKFEEAMYYKNLYEAVWWVTQESKGLASYLRESHKPVAAMRELRDILARYGRESLLVRIEGYDVATLSQKNTVGSMVVFLWGARDVSEYRKFLIRDWGGGDVGAMSEMVSRRMRHKDWGRPDLILVDGGKGQVGVVMKKIPWEIPVLGLMKKEEILVIPTESGFEEVELSRESMALKLLQQVRDEAHRFATGYHKRVRSRRMLS